MADPTSRWTLWRPQDLRNRRLHKARSATSLKPLEKLNLTACGPTIPKRPSTTPKSSSYENLATPRSVVFASHDEMAAALEKEVVRNCPRRSLGSYDIAPELASPSTSTSTSLIANAFTAQTSNNTEPPPPVELPGSILLEGKGYEPASEYSVIHWGRGPEKFHPAFLSDLGFTFAPGQAPVELSTSRNSTYLPYKTYSHDSAIGTPTTSSTPDSSSRAEMASSSSSVRDQDKPLPLSPGGSIRRPSSTGARTPSPSRPSNKSTAASSHRKSSFEETVEYTSQFPEAGPVQRTFHRPIPDDHSVISFDSSSTNSSAWITMAMGPSRRPVPGSGPNSSSGTSSVTPTPAPPSTSAPDAPGPSTETKMDDNKSDDQKPTEQEKPVMNEKGQLLNEQGFLLDPKKEYTSEWHRVSDTLKYRVTQLEAIAKQRSHEVDVLQKEKVELNECLEEVEDHFFKRIRALQSMVTYLDDFRVDALTTPAHEQIRAAFKLYGLIGENSPHRTYPIDVIQDRAEMLRIGQELAKQVNMVLREPVVPERDRIAVQYQAMEEECGHLRAAEAQALEDIKKLLVDIDTLTLRSRNKDEEIKEYKNFIAEIEEVIASVGGLSDSAANFPTKEKLLMLKDVVNDQNATIADLKKRHATELGEVKAFHAGEKHELKSRIDSVKNYQGELLDKLMKDVADRERQISDLEARLRQQSSFSPMMSPPDIGSPYRSPQPSLRSKFSTQTINTGYIRSPTQQTFGETQSIHTSSIRSPSQTFGEEASLPSQLDQDGRDINHELEILKAKRLHYKHEIALYKRDHQGYKEDIQGLNATIAELQGNLAEARADADKHKAESAISQQRLEEAMESHRQQRVEGTDSPLRGEQPAQLSSPRKPSTDVTTISLLNAVGQAQFFLKGARDMDTSIHQSNVKIMRMLQANIDREGSRDDVMLERQALVDFMERRDSNFDSVDDYLQMLHNGLARSRDQAIPLGPNKPPRSSIMGKFFRKNSGDQEETRQSYPAYSEQKEAEQDDTVGLGIYGDGASIERELSRSPVIMQGQHAHIVSVMAKEISVRKFEAEK